MYYVHMIKVRLHYTNKLVVENILGYMERKVTRYGSGAKVNCPKEYMGKKALLVILKD
jgi:putative transposon-encoded protein